MYATQLTCRAYHRHTTFSATSQLKLPNLQLLTSHKRLQHKFSYRVEMFNGKAKKSTNKTQSIKSERKSGETDA